MNFEKDESGMFSIMHVYSIPSTEDVASPPSPEILKIAKFS